MSDIARAAARSPRPPSPRRRSARPIRRSSGRIAVPEKPLIGFGEPAPPGPRKKYFAPPSVFVRSGVTTKNHCPASLWISTLIKLVDNLRKHL